MCLLFIRGHAHHTPATVERFQLSQHALLVSLRDARAHVRLRCVAADVLGGVLLALVPVGAGRGDFGATRHLYFLCR